MSKPMLAIMAIVVAAFGCGFGAGLMTGSGSPGANAGANGTVSVSYESSSSASAQEDVHANTLLSARIRELEGRLAAQKPDPAAEMKSKLEFFRKYKEKGFYLQCFDDFGTGPVAMTDGAAALLNLSKDERQAVEQHLTDVKKQMEQMRDADTKIVKQSPDSASYEISADPRGKEIKDQLIQQLNGDIGGDRAAFLMDEGDFNSGMGSFANFSAEKTDIEVNWKTDPAGKPLYTWSLQSVNSRWRSNTPRENVPDQIKKYLPTFDSK